MRKKPLVSIIIPAYNAESFIVEAVKSALSQSYKNIELIIIDDGSTDTTKNLLQPYIKAGTVRYYFQNNQGLSAARNRGIKLASGTYVAFLDSDDICLSHRIEEQVMALESNKSFDACYSHLFHFTDSLPRKFYWHRYAVISHSGNLLADLVKKQFINPSTVFARRSVFQERGFFNENLKRSEDWDLWLRWSYAGVQFYFINKPLICYRIRQKGNLTSFASEPIMKEANIRLFVDFFNQLDSQERIYFNEYKIFSDLEKNVALAYCIVGDKNKALKHLTRARAYASSWSLMFILAATLITPEKILQWFAIGGRILKHRLLLARIEAPLSMRDKKS